jgi:hypothetical protein
MLDDRKLEVIKVIVMSLCFQLSWLTVETHQTPLHFPYFETHASSLVVVDITISN